MRQRSPVRFDKRLRLLALAATLALAGAAASGAREGKNLAGAPTENFGKVNDHYYRGGQPDAAGFAQLRQLGIKTVIDLRKDSRPEAPEQARAEGLQYFNIPMKASRPATPEQTSYFLKLVNDPANWPVYVHCKGGRHRTGALTAVYRITHDGWTADQAWDEMKKYDFNDSFFGGPPAQKNFVYDFYRQKTAASGQR
ncbi:MAG TPA: tyrosine-protein phosphatase [Pyrinomonadaceae bacterium]|nr:tyrosine-protein phosphatase [Pyrinomonadaceae bacterium]